MFTNLSMTVVIVVIVGAIVGPVALRSYERLMQQQAATGIIAEVGAQEERMALQAVFGRPVGEEADLLYASSPLTDLLAEDYLLGSSDKTLLNRFYACLVALPDVRYITESPSCASLQAGGVCPDISERDCQRLQELELAGYTLKDGALTYAIADDEIAQRAATMRTQRGSALDVLVHQKTYDSYDARRQIESQIEKLIFKERYAEARELAERLSLIRKDLGDSYLSLLDSLQQ